MKIKSIKPLGAEISDINLSSSLNRSDFNLIKEAFLDNLLLIFKDQSLTPKDLLSAATLWGFPQKHPIFQGLEDIPEIIKIENYGERYHTNAHWHSDVTFEEEPPDATILYAIDVPLQGGNTLFANQYLAYDSLEKNLKEKLKNYFAVNTNKSVVQLAEADPSLEKTVLHPVFRTHPETGKKALFVTQAFVERIEGLNNKESEEILMKLYSHTSDKKIRYEHKWHNGDMVVWDNRCVQHYAIHDHGNKTRTLYRITVSGSKPY